MGGIHVVSILGGRVVLLALTLMTAAANSHLTTRACGLSGLGS